MLLIASPHKLPLIQDARLIQGDRCFSNWPAYYNPHREISVDETFVPFKGRIKLLEYIPSKPCTWGLKVWTLADSKSSTVWNCKVYTG